MSTPFEELSAELWSALEDRFGNVMTNQSSLIKTPNRMFSTFSKDDIEEAKELIVSVIWMVTGEQPKLRITQDYNLNVFVTSALTIDVRITPPYDGPHGASVDVTVTPRSLRNEGTMTLGQLKQAIIESRLVNYVRRL